jgi:L-malate glycosyltransferase
MKVLYFSRDYTTHDYRFLNELAKTEHQIFYLRLEKRGHALEVRPYPKDVQIVDWVGGKKPAHTIIDGFSFRKYPSALSGLRKVINRIQPDLIQAGPIQSCALLASLSKFHPLVSTSWGSDLLVEAERNLWNRWTTRFVMRHSDVLVGDCEAVRQKAILFGMDPQRIITFPWGVDLDHFKPRPTPSTGTVILLSTRSWEPIYGVEVIGRAFGMAVQAIRQRSEVPFRNDQQQSGQDQLDLRLVMLGNGSQANLLKEIFKQYRIENLVTFPGQVGQAELPAMYHQSDLYISASFSDGTSISLLEAMACGRPVLVSDIPGNQEWVRPGENGWLFPAGDAGALARGILTAIEQRNRLPEMGMAARRLAEQKADWKNNFKSLLHAYQVAIGTQTTNRK